MCCTDHSLPAAVPVMISCMSSVAPVRCLTGLSVHGVVCCCSLMRQMRSWGGAGEAMDWRKLWLAVKRAEVYLFQHSSVMIC
jgi:hypothetical protein